MTERNLRGIMQSAAAKTQEPNANPIKLTVDRALLLKSLSHVQSVVERRGTIPILANIKLETVDQSLVLSATDMDIMVSEKIAAASVAAAGATTVPAHMFYEIVRRLPEGVQLELAGDGKDGKVTLRAGSSRFSLSCLPVADFPVMDEGNFTHHFSLSSEECQTLLDKTRFAISTEETRYYLNGIYLHVAGGSDNPVLRAVATDGHRLARLEVAMPSGAAGMPGVIVPRKTVNEVKKLIEEGASAVQISVSDTKIRFVCGSAVLTSKLIDGTFPDYERVIPTNNNKIMEVEGKVFAQAVDRVSIISSEKSRGIKLVLSPGKLALSASSAEQGAASEEIEVNYAADAIETGFNSRYLLDIMAQIEGDTAQFIFSDGASPALVRDTADVGALYVIMPMRV